MALYPQLIRTGTANGTAIYIDISRLEYDYTVAVQLTAPYSMLVPPGMATRPDFTGCASSRLDAARTVATGTVLNLRPPEAAALIAAGAAQIYAPGAFTADSGIVTADAVLTADG